MKFLPRQRLAMRCMTTLLDLLLFRLKVKPYRPVRECSVQQYLSLYEQDLYPRSCVIRWLHNIRLHRALVFCFNRSYLRIWHKSDPVCGNEMSRVHGSHAQRARVNCCRSPATQLMLLRTGSVWNARLTQDVVRAALMIRTSAPLSSGASCIRTLWLIYVWWLGLCHCKPWISLGFQHLVIVLG